MDISVYNIILKKICPIVFRCRQSAVRDNSWESDCSIVGRQCIEQYSRKEGKVSQLRFLVDF